MRLVDRGPDLLVQCANQIDVTVMRHVLQVIRNAGSDLLEETSDPQVVFRGNERVEQLQRAQKYFDVANRLDAVIRDGWEVHA